MLRLTPPESISRKLSEESIQDSDVVLCTHTDINHHGRYEPQWLVITRDTLLLLEEGEPAQLIFRMSLADATEYRCRAVIGSGILEARADGMYVDILRYSNRFADRFERIAKKLDRHLHGEEIRITEEDGSDSRRCPKCGMMLQFAGDVCPRCVDKGVVLTRMWNLMKPYRMAAMGIMTLLVMGICLDLVGPQLTRYMVDHVLPGSPEAAEKFQHDPDLKASHLVMLLEVVAILAAVQILRMGINICNGRLGTKIGTSITFDMRGRLVKHLQQLSVAYYDRQQVGSLVGRVAYDTESLHGFVNQLTGGFLFQVIMLIGVGVMMFNINVRLALFTLIPAPLVAAGSLIFWKHIYPRYYRFWDASSKQAGMLSGILSGIRVVKSFGQEDREANRFTKASARLRGNRMGVDYAASTFNPIMGLVFQFGGWIVWFIGGRDVLSGTMTLGELMAYFGYLWMFYGPLSHLTQFTNWLTQFATQAHRIFEILDTPVEISDPKEPVSIEPVKGKIEFKRVTFGYSRHTPILRDLDLVIEPGEMIGIVGRSGSGKTTVVNLICRFYDVDEGCVLVDNADVRDIRKEELRGLVGVVLQEPFLFRGSIWENLTYGKPDASVEDVLLASKAGNSHDFIMRSAYGYDTWVGERGAGLSGGERQRVSISRVLLTDPKILILDEATSSVDAESEASIQAALAEVVKGRTTIAIAHRLSTLRNANRILVVDHGAIVESGPHDELVAQDGLYAKLVRMQGQVSAPTIQQLAAQSEEEEEKKKAQERVKEKAEAKTTGVLPDISSHHPRWLTPQVAQIHIGKLGALHVSVHGEEIYGGVFAVRCLPISHPWQYISLRHFNADKRETEIGLIRDLNEWQEEIQNLIRQSLGKRYFVHTIRSIESIEQIQGYLNFKVETDLGPMEFMLRWQGDRAHDYGKAGKMLIDTEENRYVIPDIDALAESERALFLRFIYW